MSHENTAGRLEFIQQWDGDQNWGWYFYQGRHCQATSGGTLTTLQESMAQASRVLACRVHPVKEGGRIVGAFVTGRTVTCRVLRAVDATADVSVS